MVENSNSCQRIHLVHVHLVGACAFNTLVAETSHIGKGARATTSLRDSVSRSEAEARFRQAIDKLQFSEFTDLGM